MPPRLPSRRRPHITDTSRMEGKGPMGLRISLGVLIVLGAVAAVYADRLPLKDAAIIDGTVFDQGAKYWVKKPDGTPQTIPKSKVESVGKGTAAPTPAVAKPGATSAP